MIQVFHNIVDYLTSVLLALGPISGIVIIILESILPMLPLGVFVALNVNAFGFLFGLLLSWGATIIGCILAYYLFGILIDKILFRLLSDKTKNQIEKITKRFRNIAFSNLVVIIAMPFTPAFLINICAALSSMSKRKFIFALLIGKLSIIFFWGYVGKSLIESITDLSTIIMICAMLGVAYFLSKVIEKKMKIN